MRTDTERDQRGRVQADLDLTNALDRVGWQTRVGRGQPIYRDGTEATWLYRVDAGAVKVVRHSSQSLKPLILDIRGPGEFLGFEGLFAERTHPESAWALAATRLTCVPQGACRSLMLRHADLLYRMMEQVYRINEQLQDRLVAFAYDEGNARLAQLLLHLNRKFGQPRANGEHLIDLPLQHRDLAEFSGLRSETVSRILTGLRSGGVLGSQRSRLVIRDLTALQQCADDSNI
ncbi:MAG: Crp/Fnr family transcriptional regulator [Candidatus Bipolaricaulia bacterium]